MARISHEFRHTFHSRHETPSCVAAAGKILQGRTFCACSGRESDFYFDGRQTALHPEGAWLIGNLFYDLLSDLPQLDAVGGMTLGADPLVTATSVISWTRERPVAAFIVRKSPKGHGTNQYIEGLANLKPARPWPCWKTW